MPTVKVVCKYCDSEVEIKYPWGGGTGECPVCEGLHGLPDATRKTTLPIGEQSRLRGATGLADRVALRDSVQQWVASEEICMAGVVYWGEERFEKISESAELIEIVATGIHPALSQPRYVGKFGILAVGKHSLFLVHLGLGTTRIGEWLPDDEAIETSVRKLVAFRVFQVERYEPADASCKGKRLFAPAISGSEVFPDEFCVVGLTTALQFKEAIRAILQVPSVTDLVKDIVSLKLESRLADLGVIFGHDGARDAFFRVIGNLKWKKQVLVLRQLREFAPQNVKVCAVEWLKRERTRHFREAFQTARLGVVCALVVVACGWATLSGAVTDDVFKAVIGIVGGIGILLCGVFLFAFPIVCWDVLRYLVPIASLKPRNR